MSNKIDERIVEMRFDNKEFEKGVQTSVKSLDNLKKGLNLEDSAKSLSNLDKVGRSFSLQGIATGVDTIASKFSTLGIIGVTTLANITNSAINAGKNLVSALTIDPILTGLDEYETKMNAITTILTNTQNKGTTLDEVNAALNDLNTYADKTIYNFAEMTRNIGTFTAAGVDLKTSATAIKGIANLAAGSGSSALQASTAMYQLSQAIASGSVKLQDWNSVVNAGMGGQLFQNALEKTAKELGKGRDMSVSFRESLEKGWITTEVLTKTLEKFANDESLIKAATQVKTFTQLIDTMKESVQSGWAQTWELIIGDREEAAKVFTAMNDAFGAMAGASADARNAMFKFWKENGGREAIIQAITNSVKTLSSVLKPIGSAFREIFPAMTGKNLVDISNSIRDMTANFKIGEPVINDIKRTFKGLFAVLDIGKQAFTAVATGIGDLVTYIFPASSGLLSFTANIGDFLVGLDETIKKVGFFQIAVSKVTGAIKIVGDGINETLNNIRDYLVKFTDISFEGLDAFRDRLLLSFKPLSVLGFLVKSVVYTVTNAVKKLAPVFYALADIIGTAMTNIRDTLFKAVGSDGDQSILGIINGGLFVGIILGIKKIINNLSDIADNAGSFLGNITDILDGVKSSLEAYQSNLKAGTLMKIAVAIGILAASLFVLSTIDKDKLASSMAAMTGMFIQLFGSMAIFEKTMGGAGFGSMLKITASMIALSTAVLILSGALKRISDLDWDGIVKGLVGISGMMIILNKAVRSMSTDSKGLMKTSLSLIVLATALNILSVAVEKIGSLDMGTLAKGILGIGALLKVLSLFMNNTDFNATTIKSSISIGILSVSLIILAKAVKDIGSIDLASLTKGVLSIGAILKILSLFMNSLNNPKNMISMAVGMGILATSLLIFSKAIESLGNLSLGQIAKGLGSMAVVLVLVTNALNRMSPNAIGKSVGLVIMATSLMILSKALETIGKMSLEEIGKGLLGMAGALIIFSLAMKSMQTGLPGAAAMFVMASALAILTAELSILGKMSLGEIGKGLLSIAGIFVVIGLAGLVLAPLTPVILSLSGAVALFGLGCIAVGVGMLAFSAGITALAASGTAGAAALVLVVTSIASLIPFILRTFAQGLIDFVVVIGNGIPEIMDAVKKIVMSVLNTLIETSPKVLEFISVMVTSWLDLMISLIPKMVDAGMKLILGILTGVANNIQKVVAAGIEVILQFIAGVSSKLQAIIDTAFKVVISFINGLADAIRNNHQAIYDAVSNLISAIVEAVMDLMPSIINTGKNIINGFISGMKNSAGSLIEAGKSIVSNMVGSVRNALDINSPSRVFYGIGEFSIMGLVNALLDLGYKATNAAKNVGLNAVDGVKDAMSNISNVINDNLNVNPTIRPVMDLDSVVSGINSMNSMLNNQNGITVNSAMSRTSSFNRNKTPDVVETKIKSVDNPINQSVKQPLTLQLMLKNGKAIAEFIVDDLDDITGSKNIITGRMIGI